jgi:hypothetical protein
MTRLLILFFIVLITVSCKKDKDPGFTSPEGSWTYTTPDGFIAVTFDVVVATSGFDVKNQTIKVNAVDAKAEKTVTAFTATAVQKIRINANDTKVTYPYDINFNNGTVSSDFKTINIADATYVYPWGTTKSLTNITITRK